MTILGVKVLEWKFIARISIVRSIVSTNGWLDWGLTILLMAVNGLLTNLMIANANIEEKDGNEKLDYHLLKDVKVKLILASIILSTFVEILFKKLFLSEKSIRNEQRQQKEIIDNVPCGVAIVSRDHDHVLYLNQGIRELITIDLQQDDNLLSKVTFQRENPEKPVSDH